MRAGPRCGRLPPGGVGLPGFGVLAGRDDRRSTSGGDGIVALARVEGTAGGNAGDLLVGRDLVKQFGQHRRIAHVAGGELNSPDFQRLRINSNVDLAPDAPFGTAVHSRVPLAFPLDFDDGHIIVTLDGDTPRRRIAFDSDCYKRFDHGYAVTIHKSQGATDDRAWVLASRSMDAPLTYVAMTRHREASQLYIDDSDKPDWSTKARLCCAKRAPMHDRPLPLAICEW